VKTIKSHVIGQLHPRETSKLRPKPSKDSSVTGFFIGYLLGALTVYLLLVFSAR
jgi:hypothetical protein